MGTITTIRRSEIPACGLHVDMLWDAALLDRLPASSRPAVEPPLRLQLRFSVDGRRITMDGGCEAQGLCVCVRCLERFAHPLSIAFRYVFVPADTQDAYRSPQLGAADLEVVPYDGEHIDLAPAVCEQILLALPAYPHCGPACRGLCPHCGANLNAGACGCSAGTGSASPFAVLGALKKKA